MQLQNAKHGRHDGENNLRLKTKKKKKKFSVHVNMYTVITGQFKEIIKGTELQ